MNADTRITIGGQWEEIDRVRVETAERLTGEYHRDVVDAISMVACELTENAIKYGALGDDGEVEVSVSCRPRAITVEVKNPIDDVAAESLSRLDTMIQWIRGYQDPFEAYLQRMEEVSRQSLDNAESGLGLVRIAYEGRAILDFYVDEHNTLAVSAVHQL